MDYGQTKGIGYTVNQLVLCRFYLSMVSSAYPGNIAPGDRRVSCDQHKKYADGKGVGDMYALGAGSDLGCDLLSEEIHQRPS